MAKKHQVRPDWANLDPLDSGIDVECIDLCQALNLLSGIKTISSCCGHGHHEFRIWFTALNLESLPPTLYNFDGCHCGHYGWKVVVTTDCGMSPVHFRVEGPVGNKAYAESKDIATFITEYVRSSEMQ